MTSVSALFDILRRGERPVWTHISDPLEFITRTTIERAEHIEVADDISPVDLVGIFHTARHRSRGVNYPLKFVTPEQANHLAFKDQDTLDEFTGYCVLIALVNGHTHALLASLDGYPAGSESKMWISILEVSGIDKYFDTSANKIVSLFMPCNSWFK